MKEESNDMLTNTMVSKPGHTKTDDNHNFHKFGQDEKSSNNSNYDEPTSEKQPVHEETINEENFDEPDTNESDSKASDTKESSTKNAAASSLTQSYPDESYVPETNLEYSNKNVQNLDEFNRNKDNSGWTGSNRKSRNSSENKPFYEHEKVTPVTGEGDVNEENKKIWKTVDAVGTSKQSGTMTPSQPKDALKDNREMEKVTQDQKIDRSEDEATGNNIDPYEQRNDDSSVAVSNGAPLWRSEQTSQNVNDDKEFKSTTDVSNKNSHKNRTRNSKLFPDSQANKPAKINQDHFVPQENTKGKSNNKVGGKMNGKGTGSEYNGSITKGLGEHRNTTKIVSENKEGKPFNGSSQSLKSEDSQLFIHDKGNKILVTNSKNYGNSKASGNEKHQNKVDNDKLLKNERFNQGSAHTSEQKENENLQHEESNTEGKKAPADNTMNEKDIENISNSKTLDVNDDSNYDVNQPDRIGENMDGSLIGNYNQVDGNEDLYGTIGDGNEKILDNSYIFNDGETQDSDYTKQVSNLWTNPSQNDPSLGASPNYDDIEPNIKFPGEQNNFYQQDSSHANEGVWNENNMNGNNEYNSLLSSMANNPQVSGQSLQDQLQDYQSNAWNGQESPYLRQIESLTDVNQDRQNSRKRKVIPHKDAKNDKRRNENEDEIYENLFTDIKEPWIQRFLTKTLQTAVNENNDYLNSSDREQDENQDNLNSNDKKQHENRNHRNSNDRKQHENKDSLNLNGREQHENQDNLHSNDKEQHENKDTLNVNGREQHENQDNLNSNKKEQHENKDTLTLNGREQHENQDNLNSNDKEQHENEDTLNSNDKEQHENKDTLNLNGREQHENQDNLNSNDKEQHENEDNLNSNDKEQHENEDNLNLNDKEQHENEDNLNSNDKEQHENKDTLNLNGREQQQADTENASKKSNGLVKDEELEMPIDATINKDDSVRKHTDGHDDLDDVNNDVYDEEDDNNNVDNDDVEKTEVNNSREDNGNMNDTLALQDMNTDEAADKKHDTVSLSTQTTQQINRTTLNSPVVTDHQSAPSIIGPLIKVIASAPNKIEASSRGQNDLYDNKKIQMTIDNALNSSIQNVGISSSNDILENAIKEKELVNVLKDAIPLNQRRPVGTEEDLKKGLDHLKDYAISLTETKGLSLAKRDNIAEELAGDLMEEMRVENKRKEEILKELMSFVKAIEVSTIKERMKAIKTQVIKASEESPENENKIRDTARKLLTDLLEHIGLPEMKRKRAKRLWMIPSC
ncbi:putative uncharacterized protein DDB_G0282133 [Xenia sp. Carnegie-2017]|uniref:putative uncharacterized protein DDB_G0282133 n=1 Tax=Xenia sp. Carnegie-2017 TaxID=2897299 RepID=UPI001F0350C9|nr:putative uncharacterized protein DDB_G0282133 [Xenia sp. Carnegie-2017]